MKEVASYNQNVVHKIHAENEVLSKRVSELAPQLDQALETIKRLTKQLSVLEENSSKVSTENNRNKEQVESLTALS